MWHEKRYLQFNDLVFDGYDMISEYSETTSFKLGQSNPYSYRHGSYLPFKSKTLLMEEGSVTMTLTLMTKKVPCEYREYYVRFAEQELVKPGRLWAIKNNEIIWAYAAVKNYHQIASNRTDRVEYDVEFTLPEGVWHKADKQKTFVLPYNVCVFMECKGYKTLNPCGDLNYSDCCSECLDKKALEQIEERCFCCCVDRITEDMALCYHLGSLQDFYLCETPYQLVYSCRDAKRFNKEPYFGQKLCVKSMCDSSVIAGRFYSETDLTVQDMTIVIDGKMHNPWITINGNTNIIEGDYDGTLIVDKSGDVYYKEGECCDPVLLDPKVWTIPSGMNYGWEINPQENGIIINLNQCCQGASCIYIEHDAVTA